MVSARAQDTKPLPPSTANSDVPPGWKLVWSDEFDKDGLPDPKNWTFEKGFVRNEEYQWYQPENAHCKNGMLIIEARKEHQPNPNYEKGSTDWRRSREFIDYSSASIKTESLHAWKYGRFEMRARIDTRSGMWPAFWTIGVEGEWPSGGEVDIMEFYRGNLLANLVWGTNKRWEGKWHSTSRPITEFNDPNWSQKFHVWRMDWDEKAIRLYVDGVLLNTTDLKETINGDGTGKNPFQQAHYIILNLAIGGQNGGDPSKTDFPARFDVDYVRVYQPASP
jgi:beta-glucanase (GH16 family)